MTNNLKIISRFLFIIEKKSNISFENILNKLKNYPFI
jgi:hypothetical protein